MNVKNVLKLDGWVQLHESELRAPDRPTLNGLAESASAALGFKVNASNLASIMQEHDIPTRRQSSQDADKFRYQQIIQDLSDENKMLKRVIAKCAAANFIPEDLKDYILGDLPVEMREALSVE